MKKNNLKPVAAAVGSGMVMAVAMSANAAENPFQMLEFRVIIFPKSVAELSSRYMPPP